MSTELDFELSKELVEFFEGKREGIIIKPVSISNGRVKKEPFNISMIFNNKIYGVWFPILRCNHYVCGNKVRYIVYDLPMSSIFCPEYYESTSYAHLYLGDMRFISHETIESENKGLIELTNCYENRISKDARDCEIYKIYIDIKVYYSFYLIQKLYQTLLSNSKLFLSFQAQQNENDKNISQISKNLNSLSLSFQAQQNENDKTFKLLFIICIINILILSYILLKN